MYGDPTGVPCPECEAEIVYNGNYFCSSCDWVSPVYEEETLEDRAFTKKLLEGLRDKRREAGRYESADRCQYYLDRWVS